MSENKILIDKTDALNIADSVRAVTNTTDKMTLLEVPEKLNRISTSVIDQTYNPDSENAQSGIAVAEAVAPLSDDRNYALSMIVDGYNTAGASKKTELLQISNATYTSETMPFFYSVISDNNISINGLNNVALSNNSFDKVNIVISPQYKIDDTIYTVTKIGDYAFSTQENTDINRTEEIRKTNMHIRSIEIPFTVTEIGDYAFAGNDSLNGGFDGTSAIETLAGLDNVTIVGTNAFENLANLKSLNLINLSVLTANFCFQCSSLECIYLSENLSSIPDNAFRQCPMLKAIKNLSNVPFSIITIGDYAFFNCYSLRDFEFVDTTITSIGERGFKACGLKHDWTKLVNCSFGTEATRLQTYPEEEIRNHKFKKTICNNAPNIISFNQIYEGWKDYELGDGTTNRNIKTAGCGWCVLTQAYNILTKSNNMTPPEYNKLVYLTDNDGNKASYFTKIDRTKGTIYGKLIVGESSTSANRIELNTISGIQSVYDKLSQGYILYAAITREEAEPDTGHALLIYGINSYGELMFTDSSVIRPNTNIISPKPFSIDLLDLFTSVYSEDRSQYEWAETINLL